MRFLRAEFENWCQFDHHVVDFGAGLTALMGPNGSGKTNLVNGLVWCLTGVNRNAGLKQDNVNQDAGRGAPAGVRLLFEHHGAEVEAARGFGKPAQSLRVDGGEALTRDREVRDKLREILGVGERVLLDYVFVAQRRIFDFLEADTEEVAKTLGQLFGVEAAGRLHDLLGEVRVPDGGSYVDGDAAAARLADAARDLAAADAELAALAGLPDPWVEARSPHNQVLADHAARVGLEAELADVAAQLAAKKERHDAAAAAAAGQRIELGRLVGERDRAAAAAAGAAEGLAAWGAYEKAAFRRFEAARDLAAWEAARDALRPPAEPPGYIPEDSQERDQLQLLHQEAEQIKAWLADWEQTGRAACDRCGTPTDRIRERVPEARARLAEVEPLVKDGARRWLESQTYRAQIQACRDVIVDAEREIADRRGRLAATPLPTLPAVPAAELRIRESLARRLEADCRRLDDEARARDGATQRLAGEVAQLEDWEAGRRAELGRLAAPSPEQVRAAQAALDAERAAAYRREQARARRVLLERQKGLAADDLERHHAHRLRSVRAANARSHLEKVRAAFHRDGLVKDAVEGYLARVRDGINDLLEAFDAPFRAHDFGGWRFRVRKSSGAVHDARRLSDGQKVLFALAFRVMVNSLFAKELGLLVLDEPTSGLDEDNLACLDVALGRLRELSKARGLQVLLVTHDRDVNLFDRVHRLAAAR